MSGEPAAAPVPPGAPSWRSTRGWPARAAVGFGRFWWDFLVGDTPEVTVATLVVLGVVALLVHTASSTAAWAVLPVLVTATLVATVLRGRRGAG